MAEPLELDANGEPDSRFRRAFTHDYDGGVLPTWLETVGAVSGQTDPTFTRMWDGMGRSMMRIGVPDASVTRQAGLRTPTFNARNNRLVRVRAQYRIPQPATSGSRTVSQQLFSTDGAGFQYGKLSSASSRAHLFATVPGSPAVSGYLQTSEPNQAGAGVYYDQSLWIDIASRTLWVGQGDLPGTRATLPAAYFSLGPVSAASVVCSGVGAHAGVLMDIYRFKVDVWDDAR